MERLVELCALMGGRYLVHGSPKQRSVPAGESAAAARERAVECLAAAARHAEANAVTYCLEPLSTRETDFVNTVVQAVEIVEQVGSPALRTMIDCSAAGQVEAEPVAALMTRWMPTGHITHVQVPGALEVPVALQAMAESDSFDALIALGCIIRGETYHFELVANESGAGVTRLSLDYQIPIANAIITTENMEQAIARQSDKGTDAARVAVEMANLLDELS